MAKTHNTDYWARRMKAMEDALLDRSYDYVENLETQFTAAQSELERRITVWYQRLADNNAITLADARRLLSQNELAEFHWTLGEYIAYGEQNALDGAWIKQLENASAKRHISRLEAMKLDIQQQAEVLYANQLDAVDAAARQAYEGGYWHTAFEVQRGLGVGTTMHAIDERRIEKVLSRPWTADGQTFRDRCWTNKQNLVNSVNTQLTQMLILGDPPDAAIKAIAKEFGVSRAKAGRLVMTESAFFASAAQKDCFNELDVEQYKIVAALDHETCSFCGDMDGRIFKMSEFEAGLTAPPFHPWCRCCTCPYFADMEGIGKRSARDAVTGERFEVPADMTYAEWKKKYVVDPAQSAGQRQKVDKNSLVDVADAYRKTATPGQGAVEYDTGYKPGKHQEEIKVANWLHNTYGGDIKLLNEANALGVKMPDYEWRGKLWELKTVTSAKSADDAIRRGLKQILANPGGIVLDYGENDFDLGEVKRLIYRRIKRGSLADVDVMILARNQTVEVLRCK